MEKLQKQYGLKDPQAIKMKILWMALKQLIISAYGDCPKNQKMLKYYDDQWKILDQHEKR